MTLLEAQALELPVIGTNHGGIPEVITHGVNGLLSPEKDVEDLAKNILFFLQNPQERIRAGREGLARVRRDFNLRTQTLALEGIYRDVIEEYSQKYAGSRA